MDDSRVVALKSLFQCIDLLEQTRPLATGCNEDYAEGINKAVGSIFEFASALLVELGVHESSDGDPYSELGPEPLSKQDAIKFTPGFVALCQELLAGPVKAVPFTFMSVRSQTFACQLLELGP